MNTITLIGEGVVDGVAEGHALVSDVDLALSLIDPASGVVKQPGHPLFGRSVAGQVLVFPAGTGSSSGSYRLMNLAEEKYAPVAIVNVQANAIVTAGAVLGCIPLIHRLSPDPISAIVTGDWVKVDARANTVVVRFEPPA